MQGTRAPWRANAAEPLEWAVRGLLQTLAGADKVASVCCPAARDAAALKEEPPRQYFPCRLAHLLRRDNPVTPGLRTLAQEEF